MGNNLVILKFVLYSIVLALILSACSYTKTSYKTEDDVKVPLNLYQETRLMDFSNELVGSEPAAFASLVGNWLVDTDDKNKILVVDGRKWEMGQETEDVADKARILYGEGYAEFLDGIHAYAYFPIAVAKEVERFEEGQIILGFKTVGGRIDQAAGIVFNLKPNGDYLVLRANALENNLVLFNYQGGKRRTIKWIANTPTASGKWHELKLIVQGNSIQGYLNGKLYLEHKESTQVTGRVGVWSKADSVVYFDDFKISGARFKGD